jgi:hypothetical protein
MGILNDGPSNLNSDQFSGQQRPEHTESITYQFPFSRYHTGHPLDQALGVKDIVSNLGSKIKGEKVSHSAILGNVAALQRGGGGNG